MTIAANVGAAVVPLAVPAAGVPVGDPGLGVLLRYLQAYLTAYAGAAWTAVAPGEPLVRSVFAHDPEQHVFSDNHLPALYAFRAKSAKKPEQIAEDWRVNYDNVKIFWVLPPCAQEREALRDPIIPKLAALIDRALRLGGDPSFVDAGDTDPYAVNNGTVFLRRAGWLKAERGDWSATNLAITPYSPGDGSRIVRRALETMVEVSERIEELAESWGQAPSQLTVSVTVAGLEVAADSELGPFNDDFSDDFET
jgi:hypothetical protein